MLAKDFELPWDEKPTDKDKLERTYEAMKKRKWLILIRTWRWVLLFWGNYQQYHLQECIQSPPSKNS